MLSDTYSDHVKLNHGRYSKYQLCSSVFDMAHDQILFFRDKSILNGPSVLQGDQSAIEHLQRPPQAQQQVPVFKIDMVHVYKLFLMHTWYLLYSS